MPENPRAQIKALEDRIAEVGPDVARGVRAQQLLENELLSKIEGQIIKYAPIAAQPEAAKQIETCGHELAALDAVIEQITEHVNTGKLRNAVRKESQDQLDRLKAITLPKVA